MDIESYAVVFGGWKLVKIRHRDAPEPIYELYDARTDPLDLENVAGDEEQTQELDAEELARLRSLGYIQ